MKIFFLRSAREDLRWFRHYYEHVFPEGRVRAQEYYRRILATLRRHPFAGPKAGDYRRMVIPRTPFILVYSATTEHIEILHIRDTRADHASDSSLDVVDIL